jgi:hypothetical protein
LNFPVFWAKLLFPNWYLKDKISHDLREGRGRSVWSGLGHGAGTVVNFLNDRPCCVVSGRMLHLRLMIVFPDSCLKGQRRAMNSHLKGDDFKL